jgi:hypothetical protein
MRFLTNSLKGREPMLIDPAKAADHAALADKFGFTDVLAQLFGAAPEPYILENGTGVIPVAGVIGKGLSPLEKMMGSADVDAVMAAIDQMTANPSVQRIAFHVSSPGGTVTGVEELANKIRGLKVDDGLHGQRDGFRRLLDRVCCGPRHRGPVGHGRFHRRLHGHP